MICQIELSADKKRRKQLSRVQQCWTHSKHHRTAREREEVAGMGWLKGIVSGTRLAGFNKILEPVCLV